MGDTDSIHKTIYNSISTRVSTPNIYLKHIALAWRMC